MENIIEQFSRALTPNTFKVFEAVSKLSCIEGLYLCGGTAQALLMHHRQSEDLDFELLGMRKVRPALAIANILQEVLAVFPGARPEFLSDNHFQIFLPGNVKLSFFRPEQNVPTLAEGFRFNNIVVPTLQDLLGMKLYVITQRLTYRDYYDIYILLKAGYSLRQGVKYACDFSRHEVHSKDILERLMTPALFPKPEDFIRLNPTERVSGKDIKKEIKQKMLKEAQEETFGGHRDKIRDAFRRYTINDADNNNS